MMLKKIQEILNRHEKTKSNLIAILRDIQEEFSYLPKEAMITVAKAVGASVGEVYGVATFYSHFTLDPKGKHVIRVCDGTACHVKKAEDLISVIEKELGLSSDMKTSKDMLFTLEIVACLGACGIAPVVVVDEQVYGSMTPQKVKDLIANIRLEESKHAK